MIRLRVLGSLELCRDDGSELRSVLAQPKRVALLAYLAAAPSGFHRRDRLLALFWPEQDEAHARDALNTAISFLRREMGRNVLTRRGSDEVAINETVCWSDAAAFRAALDARRHEDAISLYRGHLLDGFFISGAGPFEEWLGRTRDELRADAARAARTLAELRERDGNFTTAVFCARRAVDLAADDERVLRQLLEMLERLGDRAGAVQAYEAFERRLAADFDATPAPETLALIARIRAGSTVSATVGSRPQVSLESPQPLDAFGNRRWSIEGELGRGGMATVYLAREVAHDRHVALKVMHPELVLTSGVERFLREIQITARLAHPHILPLIDSGARDGVPYLVTPYVAGESLRARLSRERTLPQSDALRIAAEIAEALDYAHRSGVVHCDVKPENILLADGHAVVADFGVARALAVSGAEHGGVAGSYRYMSPEQASGSAEVDARTDVYALGCVMIEMICGEPPTGSTSPLELLVGRKAVAPRVRRIITECLTSKKDTRPSAAWVLRQLDDLRAQSGHRSRPGGPRRVAVYVTAAAAVVALGAVTRALGPRKTVGWESASMVSTAQLTHAPGLELDPAISPDGKFIAYAGGPVPGHTRIYVQPMTGGNAVAVSGDALRQHRWPSWSPDGSQLAFVAFDSDRGQSRGQVFVVPALGGTRRVIASDATFFSTPAWSPDGNTIAVPIGDTVLFHDVKSGASRRMPLQPRPGVSPALSTSTSVWAIHSIGWSPDGRHLVFVSGNPAFSFAGTAFGNLGPSSIWTAAIDGATPVRLTTKQYMTGSPVWTPDGTGILFVSNADGAWDVYHQPVDRDGRPNGESRRLTTGLNTYGLSVSRDGSRLAYSVLNSRSNIVGAPITTRVAQASDLRIVTDENQTVETVDVSPDGQWLAFDSNRSGASHIYKMPTAGGQLTQLTDGPENDFAPRWSPDGTRIAFHRRNASRDGLRDVRVMSADGSEQTRISADSLDNSYPIWSPDGGRIIWGRQSSERRTDGHWSPPVPDSTRGLWTSDRRFLVFRQRGDLFIQPVTGRPMRLFGRDDRRALTVTFTVGADPKVVYVRTIDSVGVHSFYAVPVTGGRPRLIVRLDDLPGRAARVLFSAGRRELYFTLSTAESDIWVMSLRR